MNSRVKNLSNSGPREVESVKQDIQNTKEAINITEDPKTEILLTRLLKEQYQHLSELESKLPNTH